MIVRSTGNRYRGYSKFESTLHRPYDYANQGLLRHIMSHKIVETKNPILRVILQYYERTLVFIMQYVDRLHHFKNYCWVNR